jgi:integrase
MKNQNVFYDIDKFIYRKKTDKIIGYKATSFEDVSIIYGFIIKPSKVKNIQFHRLFFLLALTTGARRAEILNIKWKNIDLKEGLILIEQSKNGKPRYVPIINEIVEIIKRVKENCLNYEYLFTNSKGHHFTKYFVNNFFEIIEKAAGIHTSTHELRKYFATLLSLLSVEIQDVSKYLGHSSISQTLKYINPTNQQIAQKEKSQMEIIFPFIKTNTLTENMQEIKALLSIKSNKITHLEEVLRL